MLWIGQYAGESGIDKKRFRSRDPHAQMTRTGEYSFTGHDLQTFHQSPLQILDFRCSGFAQHTFWICDYPPPRELSAY
jgi:hypothetical protein